MSAVNELLCKNTTDPRIRLEIGEQLLEAVGNYGLPYDSTSLTNFVDIMVQWLSGTNFKVVLLALKILNAALHTTGEVMVPYLIDNLTALMERLGDSKEQVRQETIEFILTLMSCPGATPQAIFDRLNNGFSHKQWLVRVGVMLLLQQTLRIYGSASLQLSKLTPLICKLVTDPTSQVRDSAVDTLTEMYIHCGEKLYSDIQKRRYLPETKLTVILARFEDAKNAGLMANSTIFAEGSTFTDNASSSSSRTRLKKYTLSSDNSENANDFAPKYNNTAAAPPSASVTSSTTNGGGKRASSAPPVKRALPSGGKASAAGAVDEDTFFNAFEDVPRVQFYSPKELVIMISQIREILSDPNNDWEKRIEALKKLRGLLVSDAAEYKEFRDELKSLEVPFQLAAKDLRSQVVREACFSIATCCEFLSQMFRDWPKHALELNVQALQESIRIGLNDADPEARAASRKAYWGFAEHFKEQAEALFHSLEVGKQKQLKGEISQSSSSGSIGAGFKTSQENIRNSAGGGSSLLPRGIPGGRSTSDIDTGAAKRAMQRHMVVASSRTSRTPASHLNSLPRRPLPYSNNLPTVRHSPLNADDDDDLLHVHHAGVAGSTPRSGRGQSKSMSQPGSRSNSPSRLPTSAGRRTRPSMIPASSQSGSREHSPSRGRRFSQGENAGGYGASNEPRHTLKDMELALAAGLGAAGRRVTRERSEDLDSETSSVCSERMSNVDWELQELLKRCLATQWAERKDALLCLQQWFKSGRRFLGTDLRRICDVFSRLFVDPHHKTFTIFLDVLNDFLASARGDLNEWLYLLLTRLFAKQGSETLASVQTKLCKTMECVRESFAYDLQFHALIKYIVDPAQTPTLKVKAALLNYFNDLAHQMPAKDFINTSEVRLAISKLIQWTQEQKSVDVRRLSQNLLLALFSLNAPEFNAVLSTFSKSYQDVVYKLIQSQLKRQTGEIHSRRQSSSPGYGQNGGGGEGGALDMDFVHHSLKKTSEEIQNYSFSGVERVNGSQDSGIVDFSDGAQHKIDNNDILNGRLIENLNLNTDEDRQEEIIAEILTEMSNHNRRSVERRKAMFTLKFMTRDGSFTLWDDHFKTILLIFLETLGDDDPEIRANALRVLKEICLCQSSRFREYAELTMLKVLECHKDKEKDVARAADECAAVLATHLPPHVCLRVLNPVIRNDSGPALIAAIKMVTKVVEQLSPDQVEPFLSDIVPGILQGYDHTESCVRKASVMCLVQLHNSVGGEKLEPFLEALSSSKVKLLHVYIMKTQTSPSPTSQI